ncbi:hypothetical protein [Thiolapillus sp.]|uniref:hypothetical protein n=1 Tax=Thiolapillus sp. TaxID=2017437 RepID=UPI0025F4D5FC|nr:hypothetical protein [Thiolapillus sp.]
MSSYLEASKQAYEQAETDADFIRLEKQAFIDCSSDSIDYAVMEHTDNGVVIPLNVGWNDVGSWSALWEIGDKDDDGNVITGDVLAQDSRNCYLRSDSRLLATVGLEDIMVVDTHDVVLVAHRDQVQKVKELVNQLSGEQRKEQACLRPRDRFWDIPVPKIDSAFDNLLVPQPSWSPSTTQQLRKLVAAPYLAPI